MDNSTDDDGSGDDDDGYDKYGDGIMIVMTTILVILAMKRGLHVVIALFCNFAF